MFRDQFSNQFSN